MFLKRAWKKDLCDRAMTISPIHTSMAEGPFPLQRIHNFPLRGRGTPGLRQGHNAPCPPEAHRSGEICAKTRGVSALTGHGGTFGIEDVWDRVGSCVWRAYDCTGYAKTRTCGIVRVGFVRTRNRE